MEVRHSALGPITRVIAEAATGVSRLLHEIVEACGDVRVLRISGGTKRGRDLLARALIERKVPFRVYARADSLELLCGKRVNDVAERLKTINAKLEQSSSGLMVDSAGRSGRARTVVATIVAVFEASRARCMQAREYGHVSAAGAVQNPIVAIAGRTPFGVGLLGFRKIEREGKHLASKKEQRELESLVGADQYTVYVLDDALDTVVRQCSAVSVAFMAGEASTAASRRGDSPVTSTVQRAVRTVRENPTWFMDAVRWWNTRGRHLTDNTGGEPQYELLELSQSLTRAMQGVSSEPEHAGRWRATLVLLTAFISADFDPSDIGAEGLSFPVPEPAGFSRPGAASEISCLEQVKLVNDSIEYLLDHPPEVPMVMPPGSVSPVAVPPPQDKLQVGPVAATVRRAEARERPMRGQAVPEMQAALWEYAKANPYTSLRQVCEAINKTAGPTWRKAIDGSTLLTEWERRTVCTIPADAVPDWIPSPLTRAARKVATVDIAGKAMSAVRTRTPANDDAAIEEVDRRDSLSAYLRAVPTHDRDRLAEEAKEWDADRLERERMIEQIINQQKPMTEDRTRERRNLRSKSKQEIESWHRATRDR